jgi:hypothetical protein
MWAAPQRKIPGGAFVLHEGQEVIPLPDGLITATALCV